MISLDFTKRVKFKKIDFSQKEKPLFASYSPPLRLIKSKAGQFLSYSNLIIIGRGGSLTSFQAYFSALASFRSSKKVYFINTPDPDYLKYVQKQARPSNSLVIVISKSGNTVDVLENYLAFQDYPCLFITSLNDNPLHLIAKKRKIQVLEHPEIGGRFAGFTAVGLLPAFLVGINIDKLWRGGQQAYKDFAPQNLENLALKLAYYLFYWQKKGFLEIYWPIYSYQLFGFSELITQLIHESLAKKGKGLTVLPLLAPEAQHHTHQRYFGGPQNMQGLFLVQKKYQNDFKLKVASDLKGIPLGSFCLGKLNNLKASESVEAEFWGSFQDSKQRSIPAAAIFLESITEEAVGYLMGFFHYLVVYLAWLIKVDPYNQPEVESSKKISLARRLAKRK